MTHEIAKRVAKNMLHFALSHGSAHAKLKVRRGPARGVLLNLDLRSQASYWVGSYDSWIFDRVPLSQFLKPGAVAWDCGAFVAYYTAIFRNLVGETGHVYTFEASARNAVQIRPITAYNQWKNVTILEIAVGPERSTIAFSSEQGGASGPVGLVAGSRDHVVNGIHHVRSAGVDEIVEDLGVAAPDFIKFDLETGEIFALKNGHDVFTRKRPVILLELHGNEALESSLVFARNYDYNICDVYDLPADRGFGAARAPQEWLTHHSELAAKFMTKPPANAPHMTLAIPREWRGGILAA